MPSPTHAPEPRSHETPLARAPLQKATLLALEAPLVVRQPLRHPLCPVSALGGLGVWGRRSQECRALHFPGLGQMTDRQRPGRGL
eukprot:1144234-Pelagomonas_calceolata.AAC.7